MPRRARLPRPAGTQFVNGDFDQGTTGWVESSSGGYEIIGNSFGDGISAHSKPNAAWLGGADGETAAVEQIVTVTSATTALRYWDWVDSTESACNWDVGRIAANGSTVAVTGLCRANNTGGWLRRSVDLSVFAGQAVLVRFEVQTDGSLISSQYVDDVALEASPLGPLPVTASKNGSLVRLAWGHAAPYTGYEVWRSPSPYFLPGSDGSEKRGDVPPPAGGTAVVFDDAGATGSASANYFYLVRGAGSGTTRTSNRTGEFDFLLVKGG